MNNGHPITGHWKKAAQHPARSRPPARLWSWVMSGGWEALLLLALTAIVPFFLFYNLELNPRTWHDEGDVLSLARTVAEHGYYGVKTSDGYDTYGVVQSVGPAVILPAALIYKIFGASLVTGRVVGSILAFLTLILVYAVCRVLIGRPAGIIAILLLLAAPGVRFVYVSRQMLGIVPALGFFLAGVLLWYRAVKTGKMRYAILAGLLVGCAILSKSQYLVLGLGAFGLIAILDLLYYRLGAFKITAVVVLVGLACFGAWNGWQWLYYGPEVYAENAATLVQLGQVAYGLRMDRVIAGLRMLVGSDTDHYFLFWGFISLVHVGLISLKKDARSMGLGLLFLFTLLNLAFVLFWTIPWIWHRFAPMAVTVLLISKLYYDMGTAIAKSGSLLWSKTLDWIKNRNALATETVLAIGCAVALTSFSLWIGICYKDVLTLDVLDRVGEDVTSWPPYFSLPYQTADILNREVPPDSIIETSERELAILTDFNYHSPDQSILVQVIPYAYDHEGKNEYALGSEYFNAYNADYLVVGFFARHHQVYDMDFILENFEPVSVIGEGVFNYEILKRK